MDGFRHKSCGQFVTLWFSKSATLSVPSPRACLELSPGFTPTISPGSRGGRHPWQKTPPKKSWRVVRRPTPGPASAGEGGGPGRRGGAAGGVPLPEVRGPAGGVRGGRGGAQGPGVAAHQPPVSVPDRCATQGQTCKLQNILLLCLHLIALFLVSPLVSFIV